MSSQNIGIEYSKYYLKHLKNKLKNWTSGNEKIDNFIRERQLKVVDHDFIVFEWIPYSQFSEIKEISKSSSMTVYSAIWGDGPLHKSKRDKHYTRISNKKVALECLHNSQNPIDSLINKSKKYKYSTKFGPFLKLYGISQNPDTNDYILVQNNSLTLVNWISGNEKIDDFIKERQFKGNTRNDVVFEWIPYTQFNEIKETSKIDSITTYSAIWRNGPLYSKEYKKNKNYKRISNKAVALKCLHNSQNPIDFLINKAKKYSTEYASIYVLYGISQNPDTNDYILVQNWFIRTSGNEKIDDFIKGMQSRTKYNETLFEWIPYSQFNEIKEMGKDDSITIYSAIWKDGPLHYKNIMKENYTRDSNKNVTLKCLHSNLQDPIEFLMNEVKKYSSTIFGERGHIIYGISQNLDTNDYILVQNYFTWTSGNEKIDDFIQSMQLKTKYNDSILFEWIPCSQFSEIKEMSRGDSITTYSAIWRNGPFYKESKKSKNYKRISSKVVALKCLHNSQNPIDFLINKAEKYLANNNEVFVLYGISQNPDTSDYILVQNKSINISGNEKLDDFIQEIFHSSCNTIIECIPYSQFNEIKEMSKNGSMTMYSAIWKDGPLYKDIKWSENNTRDTNKKVALKCLHNLQDPIEFLINEVKKYSCTIFRELGLRIYGISQNLNTNDYILVQNWFIWTSGNEKIDDFIQRMRLKTKYNNILFEWIPYNQFNEIKEMGKDDSITIYSAIWRDGPLHKENDKWSANYTRDSNKKVVLKCLHNLQGSIEFLINEAKKYLTKNEEFLVLYGISQHPDTNDYILVINWTSGNEKLDNFIKKRKLYNDILFEWIPYSQLHEIKEMGKDDSIAIYSAIWRDGPLHYKNSMKENYTRDSNKKVALKCLHNLQDPIEFLMNEVKIYSSTIFGERGLMIYGISLNLDTNDYILVQNYFTWASGNEKIDDFIRSMQLKTKYNDSILFEWIPYSQFSEIKEMSRGDSTTAYSAIWRDGPLYIEDKQSKNCTRISNKVVVLECLHNSQNPIEFLVNKAEKYLDNNNEVLVFLTNQISGNKKIDDFIEKRQLKVETNNDVVFEWIPYIQFNELKEMGKSGSITIYSAIWRDGPLHKENDKWSANYTRDSNKKVTLKCLHNLQDPIEFIINEVEKYPSKMFDKRCLKIYGISQNPDTYDYILVQNSFIWTSRNKKIDNFIQEMQLKTKYNDIIFEWIPYNQFNEIKEISKSGSITLYSAIWRNGPLYKNKQSKIHMRISNNVVALKCLHNSQNTIDFLINKAKKYLTKQGSFPVLYGISQNTDTNDYILVQANFLNFTNWISGNKEFDNYVHDILYNSYETLFEWIPYNQFDEIKEMSKNGSIAIYSAIWKDGPLYKKDYNKKVALKCLHNLHYSIEFVINEVKKYSNKIFGKSCLIKIYGISQNPHTDDYILVQNNSSTFVNWISGNKEIDDFIQEMLHNSYDTIFEWIPYSQFNEIKEMNKNGSITIYSAVWRNGPLSKNYTRDSNKKVTLKCLHNLQVLIEFVINEVKRYSNSSIIFGKRVHKFYGISQNPDTNDYILVRNYLIWTSGNEKIDDFIQEMQLKTEHDNIVLEWIPYSQFDEINEMNKNGSITLYSAIWRGGPLHYKNGIREENYTRDSNKSVLLKCLHNSQNSVEFVINEAKKYSTEIRSFLVLYGISQKPDTNDYILVQNDSLIFTDFASKDDKIDDFVHKMQLKANNHNDIVFEWIPYGQFCDINEVGSGGFAEVDAYSTKLNYSNILTVYGISKDINTDRYIIVLQYAGGGNFGKWLSFNKNYECFDWKKKLQKVCSIAKGLKEIHDNQMVHHDFHTGNILFTNPSIGADVYISDMGLCKKVDNEEKTNIYGVLPYMAPEVLRGNPYTQAADIYSMGMIMYFVATGKQPFSNCAHDELLTLDICDGVRPDINEQEAPKSYIDLMKRCWNPNPNNRPNVTGLFESLLLISTTKYSYEVEIAENYRISHLKKGRKVDIYKYQLLSDLTKDLNSEYSSKILTDVTKDHNYSECLDCAI
ncbi:unnamed protein product [Rhizophagus irregularis]|nr:unnamed protein product [Rhizophagus irregularis]